MYIYVCVLCDLKKKKTKYFPLIPIPKIVYSNNGWLYFLSRCHSVNELSLSSFLVIKTQRKSPAIQGRFVDYERITENFFLFYSYNLYLQLTIYFRSFSISFYHFSFVNFHLIELSYLVWLNARENKINKIVSNRSAYFDLITLHVERGKRLQIYYENNLLYLIMISSTSAFFFYYMST